MPGKREEYMNWDESFMAVALVASSRTKDPSTYVGACIVKDNRILSTGYNGLTRGMSDDFIHWDSIGEKTGEKDKIKNTWIIHAERNAVYNYRGSLQDLQDSTLYVTLFPCLECIKTIIQVGIKKVVYLRMYQYQDDVKFGKMMLEKAGVEVCAFNKNSNLTKEEVQETTEKIQQMIKKFSPQ